MRKNPQVTGLVLNYRDAVRTGNCIRSLLDNDVEYILVWDNSEDNKKSACLLKKEFQFDKRIDIFISPYNTGFAQGVNLGIDKIKSHYPNSLLLLINNDAVLPRENLQKLVAAFQGSDTVLIAHPSIEHQNNTIGKAYYNRWLATVNYQLILGDLPFPSQLILGGFPFPSGCCSLISLKKLNKKLLDESFFMYGEDMELGFRLPAHAVVHVPEAVVIHEGSASSKLGSSFYESRMVAAHWLLAQKLAKNRLEKFMFYFFRCFLLPARGLIRSLRFRSLIPLKALYEGWRIAHGHDPIRGSSSQDVSV
jgi:GT2 family glycosyltransferase